MDVTVKLSSEHVQKIIENEIKVLFSNLVETHEIEIKASGYSYDKSVTVTLSPKEKTDG